MQRLIHRFVRATPVGLIAAAFMLAGCSGGAGGTPAAGSSSAVTSSAAPDASIAPQGGTTATCKQLTFAQVQPLLDAPITTVVVAAAGLSGGGQECRFEAADPSVNVDLPTWDNCRHQARYLRVGPPRAWICPVGGPTRARKPRVRVGRGHPGPRIAR